MVIVELIPLNKGNQVILDNTIITTIGRTSNIGCLDNKISRNHAQLFIKSDGTVWIKPIHHNPTFYKTKTDQIVTLTKDKEYQLYNNDQFGLLPNEYFYRVSIKSKDEETSDQIQTISSSTIPKSPIKENEILTIENHGAISDKPHALPSTFKKELSKEKTITTSPVEKQTHNEQKKTKEIVYDGDDETPTINIHSTEQASTSNNIDLTANSQTSSTVVGSIKRERCPYGKSCYRQNVTHRQQAIHPGDADWDTEENDKNKTKPECPYGNECYRKNPDHFNEYHHSKKRSIEVKNKPHKNKRKVSEDDDDGLPNEYDYNDDFLDDEDTSNTDGEVTDESDDDDIEWKPDKNSRYSDETNDESTDDSDKELVKQEAAKFIQGSAADYPSPVIKKPRVDNE